MLKRYGAKTWLPFIVVVWGLFMLCTGFVRNFEGLLSLRLLLGGAEAGLFPGVTYYLVSGVYALALPALRSPICAHPSVPDDTLPSTLHPDPHRYLLFGRHHCRCIWVCSAEAEGVKRRADMVCSGLLAYGLARVTTGQYEGWSWIFFVEGILTIVAGIASYFVLFNGFEDAKFLSEDDKAFMKDCIIYDSTDVPMDDSYSAQYVRDGLLDWKTYIK